MTRTWSSLTADVARSLLHLPQEGRLDLLAGGAALQLRRLPSGRVLLHLQPGRPGARGPVYVGGSDGLTVGRAAGRAIAVLRELCADPDGVEMWWPCTPGPPARPVAQVQGRLW